MGQKSPLDELSPRQQKFVQEWAVDQNGARAARDAGYSERTAESQASRLLTNVKVNTAIRHLQSKTNEKLIITKEMVVSKL